MRSTLDSSLVRTVALREATLALKSASVVIIFLLMAIGSVGLIFYVANNSGEITDPEVAQMFVMISLVAALSMCVMTNTTMVGASICDEKDKKVIEILLSAVKSEELYLGKLLGHGCVGLAQLILLWAISVVTFLISGVFPPEKFPWMAAILVLLFLIPSYFVFTALYSIAGAFTSRNEEFMVTQLPILFLFFASMALPFVQFVGLGEFGQGWVRVASMVPPLSMAAAPMEYLAGAGQVWALLASGVLLVLAAVLLVAASMQQFRRRLLR